MKQMTPEWHITSIQGEMINELQILDWEPWLWLSLKTVTFELACSWDALKGRPMNYFKRSLGPAWSCCGHHAYTCGSYLLAPGLSSGVE